MTDSLPDFERPPVVEVALSVQFEPIPGLTSAHLGMLWGRYRDRYPTCREQAALEPVNETFGQKRKPGPRVKFISNPASDVRLWFLNDDETKLVQVQRNRFIHNWRKVDFKTEYPRYPCLRESFQHELELFRAFLVDEELPDIQPNQCEVTYVNHIEQSGVWDHHGQLDRVIKYWCGQGLDDIGPEPENVSFHTRYILHDHEGKSQGRLHIGLESVYRSVDDAPVFALKLITRGMPESPQISSVLDFMDQGRKYIVRSFASITTPELHSVWGRNK